MTKNNKEKILIVDDINENIVIIQNIFKNEYEVIPATNGEEALLILNTTVLDIILLDIMMPGIDGFEVCQKIKSNPKTKDIPIIFISALSEEKDILKGFELGASDYINKPISPTIAKARVKTNLAAYNQQKQLKKLVLKRTKEINDTRLAIIQKLSNAAEYKDFESSDHIIRMTKYCQIIAKNYGFNDDDIEILKNAAPMHDIGKIAIPDEILFKNGELDDNEWEIMKTHSKIGAKIIGVHSSRLLMTARTIALEHHEKWDGSGYPFALHGNAIDINARIVAVADVFDALTSNRPYRNSLQIVKAISLINEQSGKHFDPAIVDAFNNSISKIRSIKNSNL